MARFRSNTATVTPDTVNLAGGKAYTESPKLELVGLVLTSFVQDQYYRSAKGQLDRLAELVTLVLAQDPMFPAKAAIYARNEFGMRSISHALMGEVVKQVPRLYNKSAGCTWLKHAVSMVIRRPDDALEILAYVGKPIPNALKKGLRLALGKFDEYQLAKYRGESTDCKMVDLFNLVHPFPVGAQTEIFKKLMEGDLKSKDTWESKLTQAGKEAKTDEEKAELKSQAWAELVGTGKIGYFALLRNLRNIFQQADQSTRDMALKLLNDEPRIRKSLVLPFRYLTAYKAVEEVAGTQGALEAICSACDICLANIPKLEGRTLVVVDTSGSMEATMSDKSTAKRVEIGFLLGAALAKAQEADFMIFASEAGYETIGPVPALFQAVAADRLIGKYSHGTNFHSIFSKANRAYDRIMIFSDMQGWMQGGAPDRGLAEYRRLHSCNPFIYSFNLADYGTLMFPENKVFAIAGFSEKIFGIMGLLEQDREALIHEIDKVVI